MENVKPKYAPDTSGTAPRYTGISTFMKFPHTRDLTGVDCTIVGLPFDTLASYRSGARFGPSAIRDISSFLRPSNAAQGIHPFRHLSVTDYGDLPLLPGYHEDTYSVIESEYSKIAKAGVVPIGLGGDHSITLAELRGLAKVYGPLSLVQFDAHSDTWDNYWGKKYTHGTPFRRAMEESIIDPHSSVQVGMRGTVYEPDDMDEARGFGFDLISADQVDEMAPDELINRIKQRVGSRPVFCTFDIDFFDPCYAPGTGTPEVGGFSSREGLRLVRGLTNINFVGFDVVEVLPAHDVSQITSLLAANIAYEFLCLKALEKKNNHYS
ncbi:MAG TPA: agmatinase [Bacillus sp. (in: firmicutes)]|nr:agmatinase [Bacillus sp. (in: firmicutes)]